MKHNKNLTVAAVIFVLLIIGFGCKSTTSSSSESGNNPEATAPKATAPNTADPKAAVRTAYQKSMEAKSFHSVMKTKTAQAEMNIELDFEAPDKFWMKNEMPNMQNEIVAVGKEAYIRLKGGKWSKMPAGQMPSMSEIRAKMSNEAIDMLKDFESLGSENLAGKDTSVYKFKSSVGGESVSKMWISTDNGLPLKIETESNYNGQSVKMTIGYEYDKVIKIELPKVN